MLLNGDSKTRIQDRNGRITDMASSSINSKSVSGTHLVLETSFNDPVDPIELQ